MNALVRANRLGDVVSTKIGSRRTRVGFHVLVHSMAGSGFHFPTT